MNLLRLYRNLLVFAITAYTIYHVRTTCPLSTPLSSELTSDPICSYSHRGYTLISPYVDFVANKYESSPLKPQMDIFIEKTNILIEPYIVKGQDLITKVKNSAFERTNVTQEELLANLESGSKLLSDHLTTLINFINKQLTTKVCPFICETSKAIWNYSNYAYVKIKLMLYIQWQVYIKPAMSIAKFAFLNSPLGEKCIQLTSTKHCKLVTNYIKECWIWIQNCKSYVINKWKNFRETNEALSMSKSFKLMEEKKNFLLSELNKFFDNSSSFNIANNVFNKKPSENEQQSANDQEETETSTITLTATTTVLRSTPTVVPTNEKYQSLLDFTIDGAQKDFEKEVTSISKEFASNLRLKLIDSLRKLGTDVNSNYDDIYDLLNKINVSKDSESPDYVSRQDYRDALESKRQTFESSADQISKELDNVVDQYVSEIAKVRGSILEALEEFADSSLSAYSSEIFATGSEWQEWKKFNDVKKKLIQFRDDVISQDVSKLDTEFNNAINGIKSQVNILLNEGGSYLAILRAKANLEFQSREKEEKETKEEEEQVIVQTQTVLEIIPLESQTDAPTEHVKFEVDFEHGIDNVEHVLKEINDKIEDLVEPVNEIVHPVVDPVADVVDEVVEDAIKVGAIEAIYEAADIVEAAAEEVLNAAGEMLADSVDI